MRSGLQNSATRTPSYRPRYPMPETKTDSTGKEVQLELAIPIEVMNDLINEELKCPVCLGTIQTTTTVTTCLHRFCEECIHRSLRGNLNASKTHHDCPSCRAKLASKRFTRSDIEFDKIIQVFQSALDKQTGSSSSKNQQTENHHFATSSSSSPHLTPLTSSFDLQKARNLHAEKVRAFQIRQQQWKKHQLQHGHSQHHHTAMTAAATFNYKRAMTTSTSSSSSTPGNKQANNKAPLTLNVRSASSSSAAAGAGSAAQQPMAPRICLALFPWPQPQPPSTADDQPSLGEVASTAAVAAVAAVAVVDGVAADKQQRPDKSNDIFPAFKRQKIEEEENASSSNNDQAAAATAPDQAATTAAATPTPTSLPALSLPYLKVPFTLQIGDLKHYLQAKCQLSAEKYERLEIVIKTYTPATAPTAASIAAPTATTTATSTATGTAEVAADTATATGTAAGAAASAATVATPADLLQPKPEEEEERMVVQDIVLDEGLTLHDVSVALWDAKRELILYYRLFEGERPQPPQNSPVVDSEQVVTSQESSQQEVVMMDVVTTAAESIVQPAIPAVAAGST